MMYQVETSMTYVKKKLYQVKEELRTLDALELPGHIESDAASLLAQINDAREQAQHLIDAALEYDDDGGFDDFDKLRY